MAFSFFGMTGKGFGYRVKADLVSTKIEFKKKRIRRMVEVDEEFRAKIIKNPAAALLQVGVDIGSVPVETKFERMGVRGCFLYFDISLGRENIIGQMPGPLGASINVTIQLPGDIELPHHKNSWVYAEIMEGKKRKKD